MTRKLTLRLSATVTPFGVGAIYDVLGESLIACDTNYWQDSGRKLPARRLTEKLRLDEIRTAPSSGSMWGNDRSWKTMVPYARFPKWLFCANCRGMYHWNAGREQEHEGGPPVCPLNKCSRRRLTPMRFIAVCEFGHAMDVPWFEWAHSRSSTPAQKQCQKRNRLTFRAGKGGSSGLDSLWINCHECDASRSLQGITGPGAITQIGRLCEGRQPWQPVSANAPCDATPTVVQRGAGNAYFAVVESALDIPPWSHRDDENEQHILAVTSTTEFTTLRNAGADSPIWDTLVNMIATNAGLDHALVDQICREVLAHPVDKSSPPPDADLRLELLDEEWSAFHEEVNLDRGPGDTFVIQQEAVVDSPDDAPAPHRLLVDLVGKVIVATRLREVRALRGFSRLETRHRVNPDLKPDGQQTWLPGIEVYGEGLFVTLNEEAVCDWETRPEVVDRAAELEARRAQSFQGQTFLTDTASARMVMTHTLAHVLIRQLAFECGYASASLRERLYVKRGPGGRAGLLVYTAAGDSEGSLGGLARQGQAPRLAETLVAGLSQAAWCSTDPVCIESDGQGVAAMNLAACHACALVAETSCTHFNSLLDRELLVGSLGLFAAVPQAGLDAAAR